MTETRAADVNRNRTVQIVMTGMMAALIGVMSQISFNLPGGVPVTMQTFAVALAACTLGPKLGTLSVLVYLLLGAVGVPVFAGFGAGPASFAGPAGGYLYGFLPMAFFCGLKRFTTPRGASFAQTLKGLALPLAFGMIGLACCHVPGVLQLAAVGGFSLPVAFGYGSAPFIAKDIVSVILACLLAREIRRAVPAIRN